MESEDKDLIEWSYLPQKEFATKIKEKYNYDYDPELSSMDTKVFYDQNKKPKIAYRGSTRVSDWISNINIGLGNKDKSLDEAINTAQKVKQKYGSAPLTYGHSRGGLLSEYASDVTGGKSITYNKATIPKDIFKKISKNQTDYRTSGDLVSLPSVLQGIKKTIKLPKKVNPLDAHGFKYI